uniref:ATP synthase complex subunit 8 n=1 Tax=Pardachirus pavoninus TaxID=8286 RepID=X2L4R9_PARPV|nr:ATP synthase F0 subunit 8 [Pardachirus pavoninus]AHN95321.1 ATP synthase F0 subunit 8 [Pardachirus pavoninus]AID59827.1 ATP synthase F0 subunit 8 [Pardachirus pavoninus]BAX09219.1 ATPase subunit 8 [Pardachirus pavoninus]
MPQLDVKPWVPVLAVTWLAFLFLLPPKVISHRHHTNPTNPAKNKQTKNPWNWPWH